MIKKERGDNVTWQKREIKEEEKKKWVIGDTRDSVFDTRYC
jgi:hypothetical protein